MASKNKGGRPPRAKGEKLQRINLTLRPSVLFGLEVVAKHRRTSMSQAAEYLITQAIRTYEVDNVPVIRLLDEWADIFKNAGWKSASGREVDKDQIRDHFITALLGSEAGRIILSPRSVLSPTDAFFQDAFYEAMLRPTDRDMNKIRGMAIWGLTNPSALTGFYEVAKVAEQEGRSVTDAAALMVYDMPDAPEGGV